MAGSEKRGGERGLDKPILSVNCKHEGVGGEARKIQLLKSEERWADCREERQASSIGVWGIDGKTIPYGVSFILILTNKFFGNYFSFSYGCFEPRFHFQCDMCCPKVENDPPSFSRFRGS